MRDLSERQFREAMERAGWTKPDFQFLGYWQHVSGLHMSRWNYGTNRQALAAFIRAGDESTARHASRSASKGEA